MELTLLQPRTQSLHKQIRIFNEFTDVIPLRKLIHKAIEICYSGYYEEEVVRFCKDMHQFDTILFRARTGQTIVCTINNKICGTGTLTDNKIHAIYTDPAFQRKGIGKRIIYCLLQEAKQQGMSNVLVEAIPGSKGFYEKFGFKTVREESIGVDLVNKYSHFIMEKTI